METILIPTDFSPAATNALKYGIELAKYFDSKIVLVNAYPIPPVTYDVGIPLDMVKGMQDSSEGALNELKSKYPDFDIECFSAMGFAYDVIEQASKKYNPDLIVMGIVGEAGQLKKHVIGSTAVSVAKKLNVPTFIIPENVKYSHIRKIAFACDYDKTEESAMIYVVKYFGNVFDAEVNIINVEPYHEVVTVDKWFTAEYLNEKLKTVKHNLHFLCNEDVTDGIEEYLKSNQTDVLMINPKKHDLFHTLFKENVTKELVFKVNLPILAIH